MDFLSGRTTEVKTVSGFSDSHVVKKNGMPQESVIYPTLFSVIINNIFESVPSGTERSLFADDGAL